MNTNFSLAIEIFLLSFVLSIIFTFVVIKVASYLKILDYPSSVRKIHNNPTPLLGGVAIFLAWLITLAFLYFQGQLFDTKIAVATVASFLLGGLILVINGALDDKYNLAPKISIWGPILASVVVIIGGLKITFVTNPGGGVWDLASLVAGQAWLFSIISGLITFIWLMLITYTTKLLDGIDGLATSVGLVASIIIFTLSLSWDIKGSTTSLLAIALSGALLGFVIFNWHPAKIFLGEGGSTFIGFALGVLALISGSKIATALLVMGLPWLDIFWVIVRRIKRGQAFWQGDNDHLHFRLLESGFKQKQIVLLYSVVSLFFGIIALFFSTKAKIFSFFILLLLMFFISRSLNKKLSHERVPS